ncbi:MAG: AAA family ATPase [Candidatus Competibacteraceae bacterium]
MRHKTLAVLRYLIEHRDRVVSRDELSQAIWPGRFGTDAAPKQCILELRKVLGDTPHQPRFIATFGRHGYRFVGLVEAGFDPLAEPDGGDPDRPDSVRRNYCVGREAVSDRLRAAWEHARAGRPHSVLLLGPAGIGKTTLAETFLQRIDAGRGWVARGQCVEHYGAGEPYLPLLDALGALARGGWRNRLITVLDRQAPLWLLQLPALIPPGGDAALRQRVRDADGARMPRELTAALEALTDVEPGILLLEDLQWAAPATLEWLNAWTLRRDARLLVIATWRTGEGGVKRVGNQLAPGLLNEWRRRPAVTLLPLVELEPAAVEGYLMARFADAGLASRLAPVLYQRSGGYPLLMDALVEQWLARGFLTPCAEAWRLAADPATLARGIPLAGRALIEKRLAGLSFDERQTLEAASALGVEFTTALLAAVLDCDRDAQERRCAALAGRYGLLREAGLSLEPDETVATRYAFHHELYGEVIYEQLSAGRRGLLHRRAGQHLETVHAGRTDASAAALAVHVEQGYHPPQVSRSYRLAH